MQLSLETYAFEAAYWYPPLGELLVFSYFSLAYYFRLAVASSSFEAKQSRSRIDYFVDGVNCIVPELSSLIGYRIAVIAVSLVNIGISFYVCLRTILIAWLTLVFVAGGSTAFHGRLRLESRSNGGVLALLGTARLEGGEFTLVRSSSLDDGNVSATAAPWRLFVHACDIGAITVSMLKISSKMILSSSHRHRHAFAAA